MKDGSLVTSGGRVLGAVDIADTLGEAIDNAYALVNKITFEGAYFRHDIGRRAMAALEEN